MITHDWLRLGSSIRQHRFGEAGIRAGTCPSLPLREMTIASSVGAALAVGNNFCILSPRKGS